MEIKLFKQYGLNELEDFLITNNYSELFINEKSFRSILKQSSIFFSLEGCNRLISTLLCELGLSYVQQSQRYVDMSFNGYSFVEKIFSEYGEKIERLIGKSFSLYEKMSELKEGIKTNGRPKIEDYKYGIPIEDARYILPLACNTNIVVTLTGDKLLDIYKMINKYYPILENLKEKLFEKYIPCNILRYIRSFAHKNSYVYIEKLFYKDFFKKINEKDNLILLNNFENAIINTGLGAATSTHSIPASEIYKKWDNKTIEKAEAITKRVMNYGHESIIEQSRTTFGMMMSLTAYHQFIRHRLPNNNREDLSDVLFDTNRKVIIPPTIKVSKFLNEYIKIAEEFRELRKEIFFETEKKEYGLLLNCDQIKVITNTNARIDSDIMEKRTCLNAQWEIRNLYLKKLIALRNISEILYEGALPPCMKGGCKEGKLSCGKSEIIRDIIEGV